MEPLTRLRLSSRPDRALFVVALGVMAAVSPMATDVYLASIPAVAGFFDAPITAVQLSLSTYMIGMAVGQFLLGPISDMLGRRRLIIAGSVVFVLASVGIALSSSITVMLSLRAVQGAAGAAGVVIGRAMVSDTTTGTDAAKMYTLLGTITSMAPIVAPLLGGVIATWAPWQTVFWLLAGFGLLMLAGAVLVLRETLPPRQRSEAGVARIFVGAGQVMRDPVFMGWALALAFGFGALFSYISASSFVLQNVVGLTEIGFSAAFAVCALGGVLGGLLNLRLLGTFSPGAILRTALLVMTVINVAGLLALLLGAPEWTILVHVVLAQACFGFVMGNAIALAQDRARERAGAGSAVLGLLQFLVAGLASPLTGIGGDDTALPMSEFMLVFSVLALIAAVAAVRLSKRTAAG